MEELVWIPPRLLPAPSSPGAERQELPVNWLCRVLAEVPLAILTEAVGTGADHTGFSVDS